MSTTELDRFIQEARADRQGTLIALDVDGTVSAIVASPDEATVTDELRATLEGVLASYPLWFVSGREADVAREIVGIAAAGYVGAHGLEVLDGDGLRPLVAGPDLQPLLGQVIEAVTNDVPEAAPYVERKRWGVSFHYRELASSPELPARLRRSIEARLTPELSLRTGKMVYEVVPALGRDKGTALTWLIDTIHPRRALVAGDDLTDLTMFRVLAERRSDGDIAGLVVAVLHGAETPEELVAAADVSVEGVPGLHRLLTTLLGESDRSA
ncbi:MAG: trehalose-phosphatase [Chloroflexi bacterium]|nr:trehalose-phosphatase [Chloroflexota bacterium]